MMMRRYEDAIRSFVNVLLYVQRAKHIIQTKSYQFEQVSEKTFVCLIIQGLTKSNHFKQLGERNCHGCEMVSVKII